MLPVSSVIFNAFAKNLGASSNGIISSIQKGSENSLKLEEFDKILDLIEEVERDIFKKIEKFLK